jgi:hypothetical protein
MSVDERLIARLGQLIERGDQVIATHRPNPPGVIGFPTLDSGAFSEWQTQSLSFLTRLLGPGDTYVETFKEHADQGFPSSVQQGQGILRAVRGDVELGYLTNVRTLVAAEVFSDFLEMARHLLDAGYVHPAASLIGAVLENGLRQIASASNVNVKASDDLSALDTKLANAEVYSRLIQKRVRVWMDVRNHADHGQFEKITEADVRDMFDGVSSLLSSQMT